MPAVPDAGRDIVKWTAPQLEGDRFPPSFLVERGDHETLAFHERGQMQRVKTDVGE